VTQEEDIGRQDVEAYLETRRELGPAYEREIVDAFADRIERAVEGRVASAVAHGSRQGAVVAKRQTQQFVLVILSLVAAIPISIVLGVTEHFGALLVAWVGLVAVNATFAWSGRRDLRG
jgi:hypothetical protein